MAGPVGLEVGRGVGADSVLGGSAEAEGKELTVLFPVGWDCSGTAGLLPGEVVGALDTALDVSDGSETWNTVLETGAKVSSPWKFLLASVSADDVPDTTSSDAGGEEETAASGNFPD